MAVSYQTASGGVPARLGGERAEDLGPRVARLVDAVPESHEAPLLARAWRVKASASSGWPISSRVSHDRLARAAVEGALERADRRRHRGVHVGERRRDHPGGEGRGVQLVLRVEDESRIEGPHRARREASARRACRGSSRRARDPGAGRWAGGRSGSGGRRWSATTRGRRAASPCAGWLRASCPPRRGRARPESATPIWSTRIGCIVFGRSFSTFTASAGSGAASISSLRKAASSLRAGEIAVPEEPDDFLERGVTRQVLDRVSLVGEAPVDPVQIAEPRGGRDDTLETSDQPTVGSGHATAFLGKGVRLSPDGSAGVERGRRRAICDNRGGRRGQADGISCRRFDRPSSGSERGPPASRSSRTGRSRAPWP